MEEKIVVRTNRQSGIAGIIIGAVFLVFGLAMFILIGRDVNENVAPFLYLFMALWAVVCSIIIGFGIVSLKRGGLKIVDIEHRTNKPGPGGSED